MKVKKHLLLIGAIFVASLSGLAASGLLSSSRTITSSGFVSMINVEVFWDNECTQTANSVDWGTPSPGDSVSRTLYVKNSGTVPMNLSLTTSDWIPSEASSFLLLSWDRESVVVAPGDVLNAVLTLDVSQGISDITDFSFNIIIEGLG